MGPAFALFWMAFCESIFATELFEYRPARCLLSLNVSNINRMPKVKSDYCSLSRGVF